MGEIKPFYFEGTIAASKSLMNRALIVQSFFEKLSIVGESQCNDVVKMREALLSLSFNEAMDCGAAGTTLRFLMARVSREEGEFFLHGDERLFSRPHQGLIKLLEQLDVKVDFPEKNYIRVVSKGWRNQKILKVDLSQSSQFASALLLSAWNLENDLTLELSVNKNSYSYLKMTMDFLIQMGMEINIESDKVKVPALQTLKIDQAVVEPDMSSCFAIAAFGASLGEVKIKNFPSSSLQPDFEFIDILKKMSVDVSYEKVDQVLNIKKPQVLRAVELDLNNNPDLFPVLSVLLLKAHGISEITGIDHLVYKESDRIQNTIDLIESVGGRCSYENKKFKIYGNPQLVLNKSIVFNPDEDHRMAMAASLLVGMGADIEITDKKVVDKSFPEFWQAVGQL